MKTRKKLFAILAVCGLLFFGTGCFNKHVSITGDRFKDEMEQMKFTVTDATAQMSSYTYIKQVYIAISEDKSFQIEYYYLSDSEYASKFYENNKKIFDDGKESGAVHTEVALNNYAKYTLTESNKYKIVSKNDNTVIYLNVDSSHKKEVNKILDKLGY